MHLRIFAGCVFAYAVTIGIASRPAVADLVVTFTDVEDQVPAGHLPDTGGILVPTNQNFQENGIHVEAWWAKTNLTGYYTHPDNGHFHHVEYGYETSHGFDNDDGPNNTGDGADLQGLYIRMVDGSPFNFVSLDWNLSGTLTATDILLSTSFDPTQAWDSQFAEFPVTKVAGFSTLTVSGFENVTQLFISAALGSDPNRNLLQIDNITLSAVPEASIVLFGTALTLATATIALLRRKQR